jgi:hypothetical protein
MTKELPNDESCDASNIPFWGAELSVVREEPNATGNKYDLEERTARFGETVIDFAKTIPQGPITNRLIDQLVGCGTSIGVNYCEADMPSLVRNSSFESARAKRNRAKQNTFSE